MSLPVLALFTAANGLPSARLQLANGAVRHLHSAVDPALDEALFADLCADPLPGGSISIALGVGLGYQLLPLIAGLSSEDLLILIDPYPEAITHALGHVLSVRLSRLRIPMKSLRPSPLRGRGISPRPASSAIPPP